MLSELMIPTCAMIKNIIEVELGYINTRHPDFIIGAKDSLNSTFISLSLIRLGARQS